MWGESELLSDMLHHHKWALSILFEHFLISPSPTYNREDSKRDGDMSRNIFLYILFSRGKILEILTILQDI